MCSITKIDLKFPPEFVACQIKCDVALDKLAKPLMSVNREGVLNRLNQSEDDHPLQIFFASNDDREVFAKSARGVSYARRCDITSESKQHLRILFEPQEVFAVLEVRSPALEFKFYKEIRKRSVTIAGPSSHPQFILELLGKFSKEAVEHYETGRARQNPSSLWVRLSNGANFSVLRSSAKDQIQVMIASRFEEEAMEGTKWWFSKLFDELADGWEAQVLISHDSRDNYDSHESYEWSRDLCHSVVKDWSLFMPNGYRKRFNPFQRPKEFGKFGMHYPLLWFSDGFEDRMSGVFLNVVHKQAGSYLELNSFQGKPMIEDVFKQLKIEVPALKDAELEYWNGHPSDRWYPT